MLEDSKIIELFFRRSEKAISALSEKYGKMCFKVAFRILNNREDSEECVNDSYLSAWNTIPPQEPNPLVAYILKITRNQALNRYDYNSAKKRSCSYSVCLEEVGFMLGSDDEPEKCLEMQQITDCINRFLEHLSDTNRVLFMRRYWHMDTYEELSVLTGIKTGALKVRISRLRNELKEYLEKNEVTL